MKTSIVGGPLANLGRKPKIVGGVADLPATGRCECEEEAPSACWDCCEETPGRSTPSAAAAG